MFTMINPFEMSKDGCPLVIKNVEKWTLNGKEDHQCIRHFVEVLRARSHRGLGDNWGVPPL